jgi:hypothetical protein
MNARSRLAHGPDDDAIGVQLPPAIECHSLDGLCGGNRGVDVARNQTEFALEGQIIEEDLRDGLGDCVGFGVARERDEIRYCDARRSAGFAADRRTNLTRLLGSGRLRRRRRRRLLSRCW